MAELQKTTFSSDDPSVSEDAVKDVLKSEYSYLRENLSIDNEVASKLFGWSPQLLGDPPYREILSLNERGKHFDAFERWYQFAESSYTADRLKVFCECLAEIGSPTRPKLVDAGRRVFEKLVGEPMSGCPPQSWTVVTSTTAEPTPSLSSSDNERTRKLKEVYSQCHERRKRFYKNVPAVATGAAVPDVQFINLATVERPSYRAKREKDIHDFVQASIHGIDGYYEQSEKIHYKDILSHCDVKSGKRVLITGAPGCGKTTLSRQLRRDLYSQTVANEYQLVLLVELRRLKVALDSVEEDIDLQYLLKEFKRTLNLPSLCQVLEDSDGEGVALILDGYDEIADRLGKSPLLSDLLSVDNPYLNQCDVFVTTRPSRCSDVMSLIQRPHCHVEILGFTDSDIDSYIDSFFRGVYRNNRSQRQAKSKEMIHRLKSLHLVRGMCRIPRVLEIVCKVQDRLGDDPLPMTLSLIFSKYICNQLLEYLKWVGKRAPKIQDVLQVPEDLFPGFYSLCEVAYKCCTDKRGQRLILTDDDLGDLKQYLDECGSVYSLLFSENIDEECTDEGVLYQFNHKTVMETLAAVYIAKQSPQHQELIWKEWFAVPEMGEVWRVYCGLTRLEHVNLSSLSFSSLSERAREVMDQAFGFLRDDNMLVMMSLYEANNSSISGQVLQAVFKNTIHAAINTIYAYVTFPYDSQVVSYATSHHPNLQKVGLAFPMDSDLSGSDLKPLNESIRNLKAVELFDPPVETVLSALSGQVEELRLSILERKGYWKSVGDALEANHCLRSLDIVIHSESSHELPVMMKGLCRNERLTELSIDTRDLAGHPWIPVESLKRLLVYRKKCRVRMRLTPQQWCVVLLGLKDAKKLKELFVYMREVEDYPTRGAVHDQSDERLIRLNIFTTLEEMIATHDHLVKVDVGCDGEMLKYVGDLVLAMSRGAFRNSNISELRVVIGGALRSKVVFPSARSVLLPFVKTSAHTDHITCVGFEYPLSPIVEVLGDKWCDLLVTGPMSRPVCHLNLRLAPAECGLLLSRVHNAEQLEELSLATIAWSDKSPVYVQAVDVQAVEGALSNCRLRKLRINVGYILEVPPQQTSLFCAVLRGIAANHNDMDFMLQGGGLDGEHLMSQLPRHCVEMIEVVKRGGSTHFISKPRTPTGNDFHATYNWISQEEAERNATELIRAEEEEKLKAEKRKLKNKKKREQKKAYKAKKKGKAAKPKDPEPDYSSHSENEEQVANETADANTIDTVTKKDDSFGWDVNSAFVKVASKHTTYVVTTESSNEESTVKTDSQTSSPPNGINVNLHTNTIGVQGRVEEYSEVEIKESRKIAALANRYAASYQFPEAVAKFTEAINMYPLDHRYYGNRSFCYEHLKSFDKALSDAESSLHILPNWPKGHFRRGKALYGLQKYQEAEEAYLKVLDLDSSYDDAKAELATTRLSCLHSLGFSEEQCRRVVNENSIQSAIDSLLGSPSPKSPSSSEFVTVNLPSKLPLNSKPERENPITNGEVVSGIDGRCSVWVGNINHDVTERQLKQIFSKCGDVDSLRVLSERHCAFVNYTSPYHATRAIEELQGHYCSGQYLLLKYPDNPRDGPFVPSKKHKVMNDKLQGPVNGDECYFWRTTGCHFGSRCFYKHLPESRGVDLQQHMTKPV